jgi:hypothetical protein
MSRSARETLEIGDMSGCGLWFKRMASRAVVHRFAGIRSSYERMKNFAVISTRLCVDEA